MEVTKYVKGSYSIHLTALEIYENYNIQFGLGLFKPLKFRDLLEQIYYHLQDTGGGATVSLMPKLYESALRDIIQTDFPESRHLDAYEAVYPTSPVSVKVLNALSDNEIIPNVQTFKQVLNSIELDIVFLYAGQGTDRIPFSRLYFNYIFTRLIGGGYAVKYLMLLDWDEDETYDRLISAGVINGVMSEQEFFELFVIQETAYNTSAINLQEPVSSDGLQHTKEYLDILITEFNNYKDMGSLNMPMVIDKFLALSQSGCVPIFNHIVFQIPILENVVHTSEDKKMLANSLMVQLGHIRDNMEANLKEIGVLIKHTNSDTREEPFWGSVTNLSDKDDILESAYIDKPLNPLGDFLSNESNNNSLLGEEQAMSLSKSDKVSTFNSIVDEGFSKPLRGQADSMYSLEGLTYKERDALKKKLLNYPSVNTSIDYLVVLGGKDIDNLILFANRVSTMGAEDIYSNMYYYDNQYVLQLHIDGEDCELLRGIEATAEEVAKIGYYTTHVLDEYGKKIIEENALEVLVNKL